MPISYREPVSRSCPACAGDITADVWLILDAQEHPQQVEALRNETLNRITCPHCSATIPAGFPLLFHDSAARLVIFAAPPDTPEPVWREQARDLHALLVGSIPIEQRRPYLGDVHITQELAGIRHHLEKWARRTTSSAPAEPAPTETAPPPATPPTAAPPDADLLLAAVEAMMTANTLDDVQSVVEQHPVLLTAESDSALVQLADVAFEQGDHTSADILREIRQLLRSFRAAPPPDMPGALERVPVVEAPPAPPGPPPEAATPSDSAGHAPPDALDLPDAAYFALLEASTTAALQQATQHHPLLLAPWVDDLLALRAEQVLEDGHEALAQQLEERREALAALHHPTPPVGSVPPGEAPPDPHILEAVQALLIADDEETIGQVLLDYPLLLTDAAQHVLWALSSEARSRGDDELAVYALECRAMLREVREGLQQE